MCLNSHLQAFLYTVVHWSLLQNRERKRTMHVIADKPDLLPFCLGSVLCNKQQTEWWTSVYKMEKGNSR